MPSKSMMSWALPAAMIIAVECVFALLIGAKVGFRYQIPFAAYSVVGASIGVAGVAAFSAVKLIGFARQRESRPWNRLLCDLPRCSGFLLGTILVGVQMALLTWTKIMLPIAVPFWAGPYLTEFDHAIFGMDPWRLTEILFGWASPAIDAAYMTWILVKFTALAVLLTAPESNRKTRALLSYFLVVSFTALGQYLLSAAGPIFYARLGFGDRFADLPMEPWVQLTSSYLWHDYLRAGGHIGTGISAMPSLHVAIALWVALVLRSFAPRFAALGFSYYAMICIGSVLLGWHYAADGFAATAITLLAWRLARRPFADDLLERLRRRTLMPAQALAARAGRPVVGN